MPEFSIDVVPLKEVVKIRNGKDWKTEPAGDVPVYGTGGFMGVRVKNAAFEGPTVLLSRKGSISVQFLEGPFWNIDTVFFTEVDLERLDIKFFYYLMQNFDLERLSVNPARPSITKSVYDNLLLSLPPLNIQQRIVEILDTFTTLNKSLNQELELRQKQYRKISRGLFERHFNDTESLTPLNAISSTYSGLRNKRKKDFEGGNSSFVTYMDAFTQPQLERVTGTVSINATEKQNEVVLGDILFTVSSEKRDETAMSCVVTNPLPTQTYLNSFCFGLRLHDPESFSFSYLAHLFRTPLMREKLVKTADGVTRFNVSKPKLLATEIPVPSMEIQCEIATILDTFSAYIKGIEREIILRRSQFDYYRNKLLIFPTV